MGEEKRHQNTCDATNPKEKVLGQLWGIDLFLVHPVVLLSIIESRTEEYSLALANQIRTMEETIQKNITENTSKKARNAFFEDHNFIFYSSVLCSPLQ
jgi:hypothetical protein